MMNYPTSFAALLEKGLVQAVDLQKIALDFCAREATSVIDIWKKASFPGTTYMADAAQTGIRDFMAMQKDMLDLFFQQSVKGIELLRPAAVAGAVEMPGVDSADTLMTQQERDAAVEMVDDIVAELAQKPNQPVVQHAAVQQKPRRANHPRRS